MTIAADLICGRPVLIAQLIEWAIFLALAAIVVWVLIPDVPQQYR